MIRTGARARALVVGAETFSRILDFNGPHHLRAVWRWRRCRGVLGASDAPGMSCHRSARRRSAWDILCTPGTVSGGQVSGVPLLKMDGQAVFKLAVGVLEKAKPVRCSTRLACQRPTLTG